MEQTEKEIKVFKVMRQLRSKYPGKDLWITYILGEMTPEDAKNYNWEDAALRP